MWPRTWLPRPSTKRPCESFASDHADIAVVVGLSAGRPSPPPSSGGCGGWTMPPAPSPDRDRPWSPRPPVHRSPASSTRAASAATAPISSGLSAARNPRVELAERQQRFDAHRGILAWPSCWPSVAHCATGGSPLSWRIEDRRPGTAMAAIQMPSAVNRLAAGCCSCLQRRLPILLLLLQRPRLGLCRSCNRQPVPRVS